MRRRPFIVLADDLTGAAEIAAIAHQAGLRALVLTTPPDGPLKADVIVCDTDTRLLAPATAARRVQSLARQLNRRPNAGFFKKVDSVLRGNVLAEIHAMVDALKLRRTLLVPCNPSLGRIIDEGRYLIASTPLHRTGFARDPHHPRRTSDVLKLLGDGRRPPDAVCCHPANRAPDEGVIVGEARSPAHVDLWASQVDDKTLPAGGADFFRMWLVHQRAGRAAVPSREISARSVLLLSGTATPPDPITPLSGPIVSVRARSVPSVAKLAGLVQSNLRTAGATSVVMSGPLVRSGGTPATITRTFASLARRLLAAGACEHLIVAGGATAACVLATLGWTRLEVLHVWGPGVVTLKPVGQANCVVTLKPGSYRWPPGLVNHFEQPVAA
ncbi:MAG TPA: four-carbon acid sugar kinase family protein [Opitutus sp.]|nr:four-carbon acid sugar kinase family protein [Opitutus sp.]